LAAVSVVVVVVVRAFEERNASRNAEARNERSNQEPIIPNLRHRPVLTR
jgi:hypothetical protein